MSLQLPDDPDQYFIKQVLEPNWDESKVVGFDVAASSSSDAFIPVNTTIDKVGAVYPSLVIQYSNETSSGTTSYNFMSSNGPGQDRYGSLVATARVQDTDDGYTGDSTNYSAVDAADLASDIIDHVENICARNAAGAGTRFHFVGSQPGPDAPDDTDESPTVRIETCTIVYGWKRTP